MGLSWKWSISEVFCRLLLGGLGPFPMGSMELTTLEQFFLEASMYGEAPQPENLKNVKLKNWSSDILNIHSGTKINLSNWTIMFFSWALPALKN